MHTACIMRLPCVYPATFALQASHWPLMRHGDALGAAVALVGDEPVDALCLTLALALTPASTLSSNPKP